MRQCEGGVGMEGEYGSGKGKMDGKYAKKVGE